mmetsp:Transcript_34315/g.63653  ORF Transcript_34315/g.63653 Transcript_34315/m.63653 type:complete len:89 (+) Transcript_34315:179-445(+)
MQCGAGVHVKKNKNLNLVNHLGGAAAPRYLAHSTTTTQRHTPGQPQGDCHHHAAAGRSSLPLPLPGFDSCNDDNDGAAAAESNLHQHT